MGTCESCGREGEETVAVRRVYLVPPDPTAGSPEELEAAAEPRAVDPPEQWCASCREHYPHQPVG